MRKLVQTEKTLAAAAAKAGMSDRTSRKYLRDGRLPSETVAERTWRTRPDPFAEVWPEIVGLFETNPGLEAKTAPFC